MNIGFRIFDFGIKNDPEIKNSEIENPKSEIKSSFADLYGHAWLQFISFQAIQRLDLFNGSPFKFRSYPAERVSRFYFIGDVIVSMFRWFSFISAFADTQPGTCRNFPAFDVIPNLQILYFHTKRISNIAQCFATLYNVV